MSLAPWETAFLFLIWNLVKRRFLSGVGIGVPPLYELARQLRKRGIDVTTILGFKTKHEVFYEREFSRIGSLSSRPMMAALAKRVL